MSVQTICLLGNRQAAWEILPRLEAALAAKSFATKFCQFPTGTHELFLDQAVARRIGDVALTVMFVTESDQATEFACVARKFPCCAIVSTAGAEGLSACRDAYFPHARLVVSEGALKGGIRLDDKSNLPAVLVPSLNWSEETTRSIAHQIAAAIPN